MFARVAAPLTLAVALVCPPPASARAQSESTVAESPENPGASRASTLWALGSVAAVGAAGSFFASAVVVFRADDLFGGRPFRALVGSSAVGLTLTVTSFALRWRARGLRRRWEPRLSFGLGPDAGYAQLSFVY